MHPVIIDTIKCQTIHSFNLIMFNNFFQSIFTNTDNYVASTCADSIYVDALSGTASVLYKDGSIYRYTNVSRRAIIKFMLDDARSLGKFINVVLKQKRVGSEYRMATLKYVLAQCSTHR